MILSGVKGVTVRGNNVKEIIRGGVTLWKTPSKVDKYTWEGVAASIKAGTYATDYAIGDLIPLDLGGEGQINMQIAAFDADDLADGSGKAHISLVSKEVLGGNYVKWGNAIVKNDDGSYQEGTGTVGGWEHCTLRTYLNDTILPLIPDDVRAGIKTVVKYTNASDAGGKMVYSVATHDAIWIPNGREANISTRESKGVAYNELFVDDASRIKYSPGGTKAMDWWLRSASSYAHVLVVGGNGNTSAKQPNSNNYICIGFCV